MGDPRDLSKLNIRKSALYAVLSAMAVAVPPVAVTGIVERMTAGTFTLLWSSVTFVSAVSYGASTGTLMGVRGLRNSWGTILVMGAVAAGNSITFSIAMRSGNPAVVSFFSGLNPVFTVILGVLCLGERLNRLEILGVLLAILGAVAITYRAEEVLVSTALIATVSGLCISVSTLLAKIAVRKLSATALVGSTRFVAALLTTLYLMLFGGFKLPSSVDLAMLVFGALFGPFLGSLFLCEALSVGETWCHALN